MLWALLAAICGFLPTAAATDYGDPRSWVCCEADKPGTSFDIFYVYPTLYYNPLRRHMEILTEVHVRERLYNYTTEQTDIIAPRARVFAPAVRQLDYTRITLAICSKRGWRNVRALAPGVDDTTAAFRYYLKHFNKGRPFILFGHSQGAMDLYLMMRKVPELSVKRGFVAAYLIGLPYLTANEIAADLAPRGIRPASRSDDLGVVIGWNTQLPKTDNFLFNARGTYCINPLNWRTDETFAGREKHRGALVYDCLEKRARIIKNFTSAQVDTKRGALIVRPPKGKRYDTAGFAGSGVLHIDDIWFFVIDIRDNIELRVKTWRKKYGR